jgi:hypothetical protein
LKKPLSQHVNDGSHLVHQHEIAHLFRNEEDLWFSPDAVTDPARLFLCGDFLGLPKGSAMESKKAMMHRRMETDVRPGVVPRDVQGTLIRNLQMYPLVI